MEIAGVTKLVSEERVGTATAKVSEELVGEGEVEVTMIRGEDDTTRLLRTFVGCEVPATVGSVDESEVGCSEVLGGKVVVLISEVTGASDVGAIVDCALVASVVDVVETSVVGAAGDGSEEILDVDEEDGGDGGGGGGGSSEVDGDGAGAGAGNSDGPATLVCICGACWMGVNVGKLLKTTKDKDGS